MIPSDYYKENLNSIVVDVTANIMNFINSIKIINEVIKSKNQSNELKLIDVIWKITLSQLLLLIDSKLINILIISIIIIYNLTNILKILQKNG